MIGALVTLVSLNLTLALVQAGQVAVTLPVMDASKTTPIALTSPSHGIPLGRVAHGVVSGIAGTVEANGLWVLTPTDADTLSLSTFDAQGNLVQSAGVNAYAGGGTISIAFPDYQILLGRRLLSLASAVASPRIAIIPTTGRAWDFEPYGGETGPATAPPTRGNAEAQAEKLEPQLATSFPTYEVLVTGCASPPSPDFGDFDATQMVVDAFFAVLFDAIGPARARILHESWPSQLDKAGAQTQRGQQWRGILELQHPVTHSPLSFVPVGTSLVMSVTPADATIPSDTTTFPVS